ncbi:hypothetical protein [Sedimentisphaera salicampi]|uniref:Glycoside hydrolase 123 C-terminal domain-containing protein n=1 Tax=Sedimentisphaera salicampi TaxID=1941349 RepID=A0A1W6LQF0_9BACT|nr:hypothetical protein [Sedimentisphaera salicampi]ARN57994.1 hypothetical protein STSP1_02420 [Sedimentisphaera salicampi]
MVRRNLVLLLSMLFMAFSVQGAEKGKLDFEKDKAVWKTAGGKEVIIPAPELIIKDWVQGKNSKMHLAVNLEGKQVKRDFVVLKYSVDSADSYYDIIGEYHLKLKPAEDNNLILCKSKLEFDSPVRTDVTVKNIFQIQGNTVKTMALPERDGILRSYNLRSGKAGAGRYELGAKAAQGVNCSEIGIPVVGVELNSVDSGRTDLAVSIDPYCGGYIKAGSDNGSTEVTVSTTYNGTVVPMNSESRTIAIEFMEDPEGKLSAPENMHPILMSFYNTIPEIEPGPDWLHEVELVYYDYLSDGGEGWYEGLKHLAEKIPEEYRDCVALCQHGWYDHFQSYAYDHAKGEMKEHWTAFPGTRKIPMSLDKMHKRFKFAKDLGFKTLIYFADGTNSDSGFKKFNPDFVLRDKNGNSRRGWKGPDSIGRPVRMDPAVDDLREWFKGYTKTLLDEFGKDLDGFVWDETFYIPVHTISYSQKTPAYSDRAMLSLVSELTQIVQSYKPNPDLAFLVSDWGNNTNALVSSGTWEDTVMHPDRWYNSMFSNYRNTLWSNLWLPVSKAVHNKYAAQLGFPQGLSNGWRDDEGPHEMPQDILNNVIERFIHNVENDNKRPRYFNENRDPVRYFKCDK